MRYLIIILLFISQNSFAKKRSFFFIPKIVSEFSSWSQDVDGGASIEGALKGNALFYGGALELIYLASKKIYISAEYRNLNGTFEYADSPDFSSDDSWSSNSNASKTEFLLGVGYKTKKFLFNLSYSPINSLSFNDYYVDFIDDATYSGQATKLEISYLIGKKVSLSGYYLTNSYSSVDFNSDKVSLPGSYNSIEFNELKLTSYGGSLNYIF